MHPRIAQLIFLPTYAWNLLLGRVLQLRHWWDEVESGILLGARPLRCDVQALYDQGVRGVVNMCDEYQGPVDLYHNLGIEQRWLRTVDFQPPTLQHIHEGVEFIQKMVDDGNKVYVHCKAGRGRSATVVLCWLMKYRNQSPEQAQATLRARRPFVNAELDRRQVVLDFEQELRTNRKAAG